MNVDSDKLSMINVSILRVPGLLWPGLGPAMEKLAGVPVDSTLVSQLKLRGKATEPAQRPPIQIMVEVCNLTIGGDSFPSGCQVIQAVVVDWYHVTGAFSRSARHQQTCNHAAKQAAHQKCFQEDSKLCILCVQWRHARHLGFASVRAMVRIASEPGRADGAVAFIQVAWSIHRGYTSRLPGYISKATMLLVSESWGERKCFLVSLRQKGENLHFRPLNIG
jgi:hypothetical protein